MTGVGTPKPPLGYTSLTPLSAEQHSALRYHKDGDYGFARGLNVAPLVAEEFGRAQAHFPILFPLKAPNLPVALLGTRRGVNDLVGENGRWRDGVYVPAYLRRYPFLLAGSETDKTRLFLCADLMAASLSQEGEESADMVEEGELLFTADGAPSPNGQEVLDFCHRYEAAALRTRATVDEFDRLGLLEEGAVVVQQGEEALRIEGFRVISREKLYALDDATLAGFTRRGVMPLIAAHHFSTTQFKDYSGGAAL